MMKNYKNYLFVLFILVACITSGCKTKKVEDTSVNYQPVIAIQDGNASSNPGYKAAEFPDGHQALLRFIATSMRYPAKAMRKGIQGRVVCRFIINEDGSVSDVEAIETVDPLLDKEAVRIIKSMPKWKPGEMDGEKVKVRHTLPIVFRLV